MRIINSLKDSMIIMLIILCIIFTMNFLDITNGFNNFTDNISRFTIIHIFNEPIYNGFLTGGLILAVLSFVYDFFIKKKDS